MATHRCFVCDQENPERIVTYTNEDCIFEFDNRFEGPKGQAHGGIAIGALTCPALQLAERDGMRYPLALSVTARINSPVPLVKPIRAKAFREVDGYQVELHDEANVILKGHVEVVDRKTTHNSIIQKPPSKHLKNLDALAELVSTDIKGLTLPVQLRKFVEEAGLPWPGVRCFGCSEADNALKLHHRLVRSGDTWTRWEIEPTFTEGDGRLATSIIVAAIDCATLYTLVAWDQDFVRQLLREKKFWTTGSYGVRFLIVPPAKNKEDYIVTARFLGIEGRKLFAISALLDSKGKVYAIGEATAIIFDFYAD